MIVAPGREKIFSFSSYFIYSQFSLLLFVPVWQLLP
uniref:Uncharacterized protein n=1 Tax=Rhizophora mucronata TaxID=61149 RepID=A0A2P2P701_RHIMU